MKQHPLTKKRKAKRGRKLAEPETWLMRKGWMRAPNCIRPEMAFLAAGVAAKAKNRNRI